MNILSLDLASTTGWCHGDAGERTPASGAILLRKPAVRKAKVIVTPAEPYGVAGANLIRFLEQRFKIARPDYVVKEAMVSIAGMLKMQNHPSHIELQCGLHMVADAVCGLHRVPVARVNVNEARVHFMGRGFVGSTNGDRDETKRLIVKRAQLLGLMPRFRDSDDQADACCIWDWACANFAFRRPTELFLFGQENGPQPEG